MAAKIATIDASSPDRRWLRRAARLIRAGEVLICPTDTGYAFAANALDEKAVAKVFALKGRAFTNPIHVTVSAFAEAGKYAEVNEAAEILARRFLPGGLTLVLPRKDIIPAVLVAGKTTVGIRVPDNKVILGLAALAKVPITSTSANISGKPTPYSAKEAVEPLGEAIEGVALVLDQGQISPPELSTIVDLTVSPPQLLRQGRIPWEEILDALREVKE